MWLKINFLPVYFPTRAAARLKQNHKTSLKKREKEQDRIDELWAKRARR